MRWLRSLFAFVTALAIVSGSSLVSAQSEMAQANAANDPVKGPRIRVLPLALPAGLEGTLSGLVRDPSGFYWSHTDGGPGTAQWTVRLVKIKAGPNGAQVMEVLPIRDEAGNPVTGDQFDPEDIAVAADGTLWLVDEIYPLIVQVSRDGQILKRVAPPEKYKGRVKGRGFEGATFAPDGQTLYVSLQTGLSSQTDKTMTWMLKYDTVQGTFTEYEYQMEKPSAYAYSSDVTPWVGTNGLAAVGPDQLLVIERDNLAGSNARIKRIYTVTMPATPTDAPVQKTLVLDAHALGYDLEKLEGIAAPNPNTLLLLNDNDGNPNIPTVIWYVQL